MQKRPQWAFFMTGHGKFQEKISGIKIKDFKRWLDFLDESIVTKLIFYWSCYSAGTNTALVMTNEQKGVQKIFSYAIMAGAAPDTVLYPASQPSIALDNFNVNDIDFANKTLKIDIHMDYAKFVLKLIGSDTIDFLQLFDELYPKVIIPKIEMSPEAFQLRMLTQVKLPGLEWFKLIDSKKICVSLGEKLAISRSMPLNISTFFGTKNKPVKPRIIMLYAYHFPFDIILRDENIPAIASMIPGESISQFERITVSPAVLLYDLVNKFKRPFWKELRKIYWIKHIDIAASIRVRTPELSALQNNLDDIYLEKRELNKKIFYDEIEASQLEAANKRVETLDQELTKLKNEIASKSVSQEMLYLSDLIIDLKDSQSSPEVFYTRNGKFYKLRFTYDIIDEKEFGFINEAEIADYHKLYQEMIDTSQPFQRELQRAKEINSIERVLKEKLNKNA